MPTFLTLAFLILLCGCVQAPQKPSTALTNVELPEELKLLQIEIQALQEDIDLHKRKLDKLEVIMVGEVGPAWQVRVRAARESAYNANQQASDLRTTRGILCRQLGALKAEEKVYQEHLTTDRWGPRNP